MPYSTATLDPYLALGVSPDATPQEIKQAYRRVALETHPDHNSGDADAAERFRRASRAYGLLRDPARRSVYDRTGRWDQDSSSADDLDAQLGEAIDFFAREFGGGGVNIPATDDWAAGHGGSVTVAVDVTYEEVERGGKRQVPTPCARCAGSGAREGSAQVRCTTCGGSGRLRHVESSFLGPKIHTETCESCRGTGRRPLLVCTSCDGSGRSPGAGYTDVLIPRGAADGDPLTSLAPGSSRFVARLVEDQRWAREGADLYVTGRIPYGLAVLGGVTDLQLPGRTYRLQVSPATASGHRVRIPDEGLPLRGGGGRGDLILTLHVAVPERVGRIERWLLEVRRNGAAADPGRSPLARLSGLQARAWHTTAGQWRQWRAQHHRSSLLRIEKAAASLRSAAGLVGRSEERLGPLLAEAFPAIAPEAAQARRRLDGDARRVQNAAMATLAVDSGLAAALTAIIWLSARHAAPSMAAGGTSWWQLLSTVHPAIFALTPLLAGLCAGALRATTADRWVHRLMAAPLGVLLAAATAATGAACYAVGAHMLSDADPVVVAMLSGALALTVGIAPFILFLLGTSLVDNLRAGVEEARDRRDRRTLRRYDAAAARLATHLERTERAFRELLTQADDAHHPLTSLLDAAADTLGTDRQWRSRTGGARAGLALVAGVAVTGVWIASTALAVITAFTLLPTAPGWLRLATAVAVAGLCVFGSVLPPALLERHRPYRFATGLATAVAVLGLVGVLGAGAGAIGAPAAGWLVAAGAVAALVLSFRLPESARATGIAATIALFGAVALVLWPVALVLAAFRGRERAVREPARS